MESPTPSSRVPSPPTWLSALVAPKQTISTSTEAWMRKRSLGQGSVSERACLGPNEEVTMLQKTLYVSAAIVLSECASRERVKVAACSSSLSLKLCLAKRTLLVKVVQNRGNLTCIFLKQGSSHGC